MDSEECFLIRSVLHSSQVSIKFIMEIAKENVPHFLTMEPVTSKRIVKVRVYRKPTSTGLLLHHKRVVARGVMAPNFLANYAVVPLPNPKNAPS